MKYALVIAALVPLLLLSKAMAITVAVNEPDAYGRTFVDVVGDIDLGDDLLFAQKVATLPDGQSVIMSLSSYGGKIAAAIPIGRLIHSKGWRTYVPPKTVCASACGLLWLASLGHTVGKDALIGLHAAYDIKTNRPSGVGNALIGAYLYEIGADTTTIYCVTAVDTGPKDALWLNADIAQQCHVTWSTLDTPRQAQNQPNITPAPMDRIAISYTRDPELGYSERSEIETDHTKSWDRKVRAIPYGTTVTITGECREYSPGEFSFISEDGYTECPVSFSIGARRLHVWTNPYFLVTSDGRSYGCVLFPDYCRRVDTDRCEKAKSRHLPLHWNGSNLCGYHDQSGRWVE
jgi:hypothetical protein